MRYCALLRAVNVGGRKVEMAPLRDTAATLGWTNIQSLLASGNLIFEARKTPAAKLEASLESAISKTFKLHSDVMIRDAVEWDRIIARNPFPREAKASPNFLVAMVFKQEIDGPVATAYLDTYKGPERVKLDGRTAYMFFPEGMGRSKLKLPTKAGVGTARNWNTVLKMAALLAT